MQVREGHSRVRRFRGLSQFWEHDTPRPCSASLEPKTDYAPKNRSSFAIKKGWPTSSLMWTMDCVAGSGVGKLFLWVKVPQGNTDPKAPRHHSGGPLRIWSSVRSSSFAANCLRARRPDRDR